MLEEEPAEAPPGREPERQAPFDHAESDDETPGIRAAVERARRAGLPGRGRRAATYPPAAKERLSRIFADDALDVEGPAYGRDEPRYSGDFGPASRPRTRP